MKINSYKTWMFFIYVILIILISTTPGSRLGFLDSLWRYDKIIHFVEYLLLGFLMINAIKVDTIKKREWIYSLLFLLFFPFIDEIFQHFTPQRIPSIYDALTDIAGGLFGAYIRGRY